jgi:hypothetical protein
MDGRAKRRFQKEKTCVSRSRKEFIDGKNRNGRQIIGNYWEIINDQDNET